MYFKLLWFINMVTKVPSLWDHSGSTGLLLYYSEDLNLYMTGSVTQVESKSKPLRLMLRVMKAIQSKMKVQQSKTGNQNRPILIK